MLSITPPSRQATSTILSSLSAGWMSDMQADIKASLAPLVAASVDAYDR
jgi:hypothetical protein